MISQIPHPRWATHAMRFNVSDASAIGRRICEQHAQAHCPSGLEYSLRFGFDLDGPFWEWYAPAVPLDAVPNQRLLDRAKLVEYGIFRCVKCGGGDSLGEMCLYEFNEGSQVFCRDCEVGGPIMRQSTEIKPQVLYVQEG